MDECVSDSCVSSWAPFHLLVSLSNFDKIVSVLSIIFYFVLFDCYLLEAYSFLKRDRKGVDEMGDVIGRVWEE